MGSLLVDQNTGRMALILQASYSLVSDTLLDHSHAIKQKNQWISAGRYRWCGLHRSLSSVWESAKSWGKLTPQRTIQTVVYTTAADNSRSTRIRYNARISPLSVGALPWYHPSFSTNSASSLWWGSSSCYISAGPDEARPCLPCQPHAHQVHAQA